MRTKYLKEYHDNGKLAYEETKVILPKDKEYLYPCRLQNIEGYCWIRTGKNAKYYDNGVLAWALYYDDNGEFLYSEKGHRKDGTNKCY